MMLQTIRKPVRALVMSSARQGLYFVPCILLLPAYFGLQGVEMCQAVADFCAFLTGLPMALPVLRQFTATSSPSVS